MPMPMRVAVIGVSHWHAAYDAFYLPILRDLGRDIVGVSDPSEAIARRRAAEFDSAPFTDYRGMIEETKPEFVFVLGRHCDMPETFRYLVDAGIPFLMEKPWGVDPDTVEGLADLAERRGAWAGVPFFPRYSFWAASVKRMIAQGELGDISHMVFRVIRPSMQRYMEWDCAWMEKKAEAGGGVLINLGAHGFDMARFLTGEDPEVVSAVLSDRINRREVEDYALVTLRTPSGILFHNEVGYTVSTWPANLGDNELKAAGERALVRAVPEGLHILGPGRDEIVPTPLGWEAGFPRAIREALEAYGRGEPPPMGPRDCARAVRLVFDSYRAAGVA